MAEIVTIGVYGYDEESFFAALVAAQVDTFCDIRRRRGVRGSEYAFANSQRLQARLVDLGIRYVHRGDLAPSLALRATQYEEDRRTHTAKRQRTILSSAFVELYRETVLADFDSEVFLRELGTDARVIALFCVEREPLACHRSLLAERLQEQLNLSVRHLVPHM